MLTTTTALLFTLAALPPFDTVQEKEPEETWYGWQTIVADGAGLGLTLGLGLTGGGELMAVTAASLLVTPAIIHGVHGNTGTAVLSVGLRLVVPLVAAWLVSNATCNERGQCGNALAGIIIGAPLGVLAVAATDALLAWEEHEEP